MTQITTTTQPGDIVVIVPRWIMRAVGFLALFCGFAFSFLVFAAGYVMEGALSAVLTLGFVPIWMIIHYLLWRFHWYLLLISMLLSSTFCTGALVLGVRIPFSIAQSQFNTTAANFLTITPISGMVALTVALLLALVINRVYTLLRSGGRDRPAPRPAQPMAEPPHDELFFDEPSQTDLSLMEQVTRKLEKTGRKAEVRGDTIHVYKGSQLVGIVRVIDRAGAISPLLVNDVAKQRDRIGVRTAYLATSGSFSSDVRSLAGRLNIQLMTV